MPHTFARASNRRYFDNAATSFPKPPGVADAMHRFMTEVGAPGRGGYAEAVEAGRIIRRCRERVAALIGAAGAPEQIVFTHNATDALNLGIKGVLGGLGPAVGSGDIHVVSTTAEHNSVLRPMNAMVASAAGLIEWTRVAVDPRTGIVDPGEMAAAVRPGRTALVIVNHAGNVTGAVQDVAAISRACRAACGNEGCDGEELVVLVDGSQSLGHVPVDVRAMEIDLLAFPGHKGLLGPQGTGGLYIRPGLESRLATVREGGTGSVSELETHPTMMPEKFEAGSHNTVGIAGLSEGVAWLLEHGIELVREHELELMRELFACFSELTELRLLGSAAAVERVGVFSFVHETLRPQELATVLEMEYGVLTRAGLHCAPLVHRAFGTSAQGGATRLSLGPFLTVDDAKFVGGALAEICRAAATAA